MERSTRGTRIADRPDHTGRRDWEVRECIGVSPGHQPGFGSRRDAMDTNLIVEAKEDHVPDCRLDAAHDGHLLSRRNCRHHTRSIEKGDKLASLALPDYGNGVELLRGQRFEWMYRAVTSRRQMNAPS
jgi:hypothetical protein